LDNPDRYLLDLNAYPWYNIGMKSKRDTMKNIERMKLNRPRQAFYRDFIAIWEKATTRRDILSQLRNLYPKLKLTDSKIQARRNFLRYKKNIVLPSRPLEEAINYDELRQYHAEVTKSSNVVNLTRTKQQG